MRSFRKLACPVIILFAALALHADLAEWVQHLAVDTGLRGVFFRSMAMPYGAIDGRRPPRETRPALTARIAAAPKDAALYRLRASEAELALDFTAAEVDWKTYASLSADRMALADYYHRRLQVQEELSVLDLVAEPAAFQRAVTLARDQGLPGDAVVAQYRAWIAHFPKDWDLRKRLLHDLTEHQQYAAAAAELRAYKQAFPEDDSIWVEEVALTMGTGTVDQAIAIFDKAFRPLMADTFLKDYFDLLKDQGRLRDFLAKARAAAAQNPESLDPVARQFHYFQNEKNTTVARRVLLEYQARKKQWTANELYDTAQLLETIQEWDQAARQYYTLYSLPSTGDAEHERGLVGLTFIMLDEAEQSVHFGAGDLSLYKDIGTMDPHPGFLNGILSLVLNGSSPSVEYQTQNQKSAAYFHRARAAQLLDLLDSRFPTAKAAPALHATLITTYASYGDDDGVVRVARKFLTAYPRSPEHISVALTMADAFARHDRTAEEAAVYDALLKELGAQTPERPEYSTVFDRYIGRLVVLNRMNDALRLYRNEIDRHPQDAALYEKLAAFLDQRGLAAQLEQVYKEAAGKFQDGSWQSKLARWYLRSKRNQDFANLTQEVVKIFSGTELEKYFREIVTPASLDAALYRQVNLYAHERFPDNLAFVKNLLEVYVRPETADTAAHAQLLRSYWFYDAQLRRWFFEGMARAGALDRDLAAVRNADAKTNPAAAQFLAEGEAWRCHFEAAEAPLRAFAAEFPGDRSVVLRAATVERSLGKTATAVALDRSLSQADPRSTDAIARTGDTLADHDLLTRATPYWNRIPTVEPGKPEGYLEAATIFWDYYRYDDALRLIAQARVRFKNPALYAYEAGAIYEGKRDFPAAIRQYILGANGDNSPAEQRLLALAANRKYRSVVDLAAAKAEFSLRVMLLEAEKRTAELQTLLKAAVPTEIDPATLDLIAQTAARAGFPAIQEAAAARQVTLSHDPVEQIRLRLALMRLQESHGDTAAARQTVEGIVRDNPASLGVVRAATDFYWRNKLQAQAISTLTAAAARSNATYRNPFTFEAARKSTESGQYPQARQLLQPLLAAEPFNGQYLAAMADTYAAASDDAGLGDFYVASIEAMKQAPLPPDERVTRIAGLRRGLIPALTRLGKFSDTVDQYIELVNRYPEDQGLIHEAATYAAHRNLAPRLTAYYAKAATDSPKDYRWPMVTGRLQTTFESFDAAIAAYAAAIKVRPDRTDLYIARGALEERLMRFSDAEKTYSSLYELSFRDASWLDKVAELQARQGKPDASVATLRKAYLEGRPDRADLLLAVAAKLDAWDMVPEGEDFARRAANGLDKQDTRTYARVMTRARRYQDVLDKLSDDPAALDSMAQAVARYYTPEERADFAAAVEKRMAAKPNSHWNTVAHQAELFDVDARILAGGADPLGPNGGQVYSLIQLQQSRMRFGELGHQLETLAAPLPQGPARAEVLTQAAEAYTSADDSAGLERIFGQIPETRRFLQIVSRGDPAKLLRWAGSRDDAADLAVASGDSSVALRAVTARGQALPPVWTRAFTALTSLYYWNTAPDATAIFGQMLGTGTIGQRLGKPVDHAQQLAGSVWFYYGARFGSYLSLKSRPEADDYLAAELEAAPGNSDAYSGLADWYVERGAAARAFTGYSHALELDPTRGEVHDRIALLFWEQGKHDEAIAQWKLAVSTFEAQQGRPNLAETFWAQAAATLEHIGEHNVTSALRPEVDSLLRHYAERHSTYRLEGLLAPVAKYHLVDFATQPMDVLQALASPNVRNAVQAQDQIVVLRRLLYLNQQLPSAERNEWAVDSWRQSLAGLLLDAGELAGARAAVASVPAGVRVDSWRGNPYLELELRIAAKAGELTAVLDGYRRNPQDAPRFDNLLTVAGRFSVRQEDAPAEQILDFAYSRELENGHFDASNFLGLAQIRLKAGDAAAATPLLRRMQLVSAEPFVDLLPAADLLEKYGHNSLATAYIEDRIRAVPWDAEARLRLGRDLTAIVTSPNIPYQIRVEAAKRGASGGEGELALLARGRITVAEANRTFYFDARLAAAPNTPDAIARMAVLLDAVAVHPDRHEPLLPLFQAAYRAGRFDLAIEAARRSPLPTTVADARELAAAYERAGNFTSARRVLEQLAGEQTSAPVREQLKQEIAAIDRRAVLQQENEARRPHVSASLEQNRVVRPRIEK